MKTWMLWHGGSSYGVGTIPEDVESFDSLQDALHEFQAREEGWNTYYPCVSDETPENGGASAWLWFAFPEGSDPYPDRVVEFGPRGGLVVSNA